MEYNIGFVVGDPSGAGHACTTDYHIVANHSADEISKAYKETTKLLGFISLVPNLMTQRVLVIVLQQKPYLRTEDSKPNVCLQVREV